MRIYLSIPFGSYLYLLNFLLTKKNVIRQKVPFLLQPIMQSVVTSNETNRNMPCDEP